VRIGFVIYGSLDTLSGGFFYDRTVVEYLQQHGSEVEIISLPWRNYPKHLLDSYNHVLLNRLASLDVDVLLEDELNHPSLFRLNKILRKRSRYPILSIVHHLRSSELHPTALLPLYRQIERNFLRSVDGFIYNSQTTRQAVEKLRGSAARHVVALPAGDRFGGLHSERILDRSRQNGPLRLLFVGNIIERKGLHTLLAAFRQIPSVPVELRVAGREDVNPAYALRMQREALLLGSRVNFLGRLTDRQLEDELGAAQVLVVPSTYEGFGIVYLEGMAFGLPALATRAGAAGEIIEDGHSGFLVAPEDPAALAQAITLLANDRSRLVTMSLAARERFEQFSSWDDTGEKIRQFLETWR
jgi:glycosyltransferase involved in cell wall biosynthesis